MKTSTPIGMLELNNFNMEDRGYSPLPEKWDYDANTQVSSLFKMGGDSKPTTTSSITSTGLFNEDSDESSDDKGTD